MVVDVFDLSVTAIFELEMRHFTEVPVHEIRDLLKDEYLFCRGLDRRVGIEIEGIILSLDDQGTRRSTRDLGRCQPMHMRMIPECPRGMFLGDVYRILLDRTIAVRTRLQLDQDIVALELTHSLRSEVQAMIVQVGGIPIVVIITASCFVSGSTGSLLRSVTKRVSPALARSVGPTR